MVSDAERMARAGEYVLGRMNERDRERAERDLETDERFRAAVVAVAERMRYFGSGRGDPAKAAAAEAVWHGLAERLAALPQMQRTDLSTVLSRPAELVVSGRPEGKRKSETAVVQAKPGFWRKAAAAFRKLFRRGLRRTGSLPQAAAVLETALIGPCAIVEVHGEGRLRLLLLGEWALGPNEQLSLWGVREDGATTRIGGFGQSIGQAWFGTAADVRYTGFQLGRENKSFVPAGRMGTPPLAEGTVKPLAGSMSAKALGSVPGAVSAKAR